MVLMGEPELLLRLVDLWTLCYRKRNSLLQPGDFLGQLLWVVTWAVAVLEETGCGKAGWENRRDLSDMRSQDSTK